jgi:outer membrane protein OmpA-like peptidoglycan-associated protein
MSVDSLIRQILVGKGVQIENVKLRGSTYGIGQFIDKDTVTGITDGIILSTGKANDAIGPNYRNGKTGIINPSYETFNDNDLLKIAKGKIFDLTTITFEFTPANDILSFSFVFASEEYPEFVNQGFNDVFAFIVEDENGDKTNLATLPNGRTPITINSINHLKNADFYQANYKRDITTVRNSDKNRLRYFWFKKQYSQYPWDLNKNHILNKYKRLRKQVEFDGLTTVIVVEHKVVPKQKYKFKIAIADVGDKNFDSGVFIKGGSFSSYNEIVDNSSAEVKQPKAVIDKDFKDNKAFKMNVLFEFDSDQISAIEREKLKELVKRMKDAPSLKCYLSGHTDDVGSDGYNELLSQRRVDTVKWFVRENLIAPSRIIIDAKGEKQPTESNSSEVGRSLNRRVEVQLK